MNLIKSFFYALQGVWHCIRRERNFRIHMVAALTVALFSYFYGVPESRIPLLVFGVIFVFVTEMINTAVETVVDLCSPEYHALAKKAKDIAAGAVLISAVCSVIIAVEVFSDLVKLRHVWDTLTASWLSVTAVIIYAAVCAVFVFSVKSKPYNQFTEH